MATKYTAAIWPPLIFPLPQRTFRNGLKQVFLAITPPFLLPVTLKGSKIGPKQAVNASQFNLVRAATTVAKVTFQAALAKPLATAYVDSFKTAAQTRAFFGIQQATYPPVPTPAPNT